MDTTKQCLWLFVMIFPNRSQVLPIAPPSHLPLPPLLTITSLRLNLVPLVDCANFRGFSVSPYLYQRQRGETSHQFDPTVVDSVGCIADICLNISTRQGWGPSDLECRSDRLEFVRPPRLTPLSNNRAGKSVQTWDRSQAGVDWSYQPQTSA